MIANICNVTQISGNVFFLHSIFFGFKFNRLVENSVSIEKNCVKNNIGFKIPDILILEIGNFATNWLFRQFAKPAVWKKAAVLGRNSRTWGLNLNLSDKLFEEKPKMLDKTDWIQIKKFKSELIRHFGALGTALSSIHVLIFYICFLHQRSPNGGRQNSAWDCVKMVDRLRKTFFYEVDQIYGFDNFADWEMFPHTSSICYHLNTMLACKMRWSLGMKSSILYISNVCHKIHFRFILLHSIDFHAGCGNRTTSS